MKSKYDNALALMKGKEPTRKAYKLLVAANGEGDGRATYALATWYLHGSPFTKKDVSRAVKMLQAAARKDIKDAIFDLAVSYECGNALKKSLKEGIPTVSSCGASGRCTVSL